MFDGWDWSGRKEGEVPPVGGYVLAGGKSSRMGTSKALLPLAGKPLVEHAVTKLRRLCAEVKILGNDPALERFAAVVRDRHQDCGPMGGIEAALLDSRFEWNLILPVDVPFLSTYYLDSWLWAVLHRPRNCRLAMVSVDAAAQPTLLIVHRDVAPFLTASLEAGKYKLLPVLEEAGEMLARRLGVKVEETFWRAQYDDFSAPEWKDATEAWRRVKKADLRQTLHARHAGPDMFANLNTQEEFAEAERWAGELDT